MPLAERCVERAPRTGGAAADDDDRAAAWHVLDGSACYYATETLADGTRANDDASQTLAPRTLRCGQCTVCAAPAGGPTAVVGTDGPDAGRGYTAAQNGEVLGALVRATAAYAGNCTQQQPQLLLPPREWQRARAADGATGMSQRDAPRTRLAAGGRVVDASLGGAAAAGVSAASSDPAAACSLDRLARGTPRRRCRIGDDLGRRRGGIADIDDAHAHRDDVLWIIREDAVALQYSTNGALIDWLHLFGGDEQRVIARGGVVHGAVIEHEATDICDGGDTGQCRRRRNAHPRPAASPYQRVMYGRVHAIAIAFVMGDASVWLRRVPCTRDATLPAWHLGSGGGGGGGGEGVRVSSIRHVDDGYGDGAKCAAAEAGTAASSLSGDACFGATHFAPSSAARGLIDIRAHGAVVSVHSVLDGDAFAVTQHDGTMTLFRTDEDANAGDFEHNADVGDERATSDGEMAARSHPSMSVPSCESRHVVWQMPSPAPLHTPSRAPAAASSSVGRRSSLHASGIAAARDRDDAGASVNDRPAADSARTPLPADGSTNAASATSRTAAAITTVATSMDDGGARIAYFDSVSCRVYGFDLRRREIIGRARALPCFAPDAPSLSSPRARAAQRAPSTMRSYAEHGAHAGRDDGGAGNGTRSAWRAHVHAICWLGDAGGSGAHGRDTVAVYDAIHDTVLVVSLSTGDFFTIDASPASFGASTVASAPNAPQCTVRGEVDGATIAHAVHGAIRVRAVAHCQDEVFGIGSVAPSAVLYETFCSRGRQAIVNEAKHADADGMARDERVAPGGDAEAPTWGNARSLQNESEGRRRRRRQQQQQQQQQDGPLFPLSTPDQAAAESRFDADAVTRFGMLADLYQSRQLLPAAASCIECALYEDTSVERQRTLLAAARHAICYAGTMNMQEEDDDENTGDGGCHDESVDHEQRQRTTRRKNDLASGGAGGGGGDINTASVRARRAAQRRESVWRTTRRLTHRWNAAAYLARARHAVRTAGAPMTHQQMAHYGAATLAQRLARYAASRLRSVAAGARATTPGSGGSEQRADGGGAVKSGVAVDDGASNAHDRAAVRVEDSAVSARQPLPARLGTALAIAQLCSGSDRGDDDQHDNGIAAAVVAGDTGDLALGRILMAWAAELLRVHAPSSARDAAVSATNARAARTTAERQLRYALLPLGRNAPSLATAMQRRMRAARAAIPPSTVARMASRCGWRRALVRDLAYAEPDLRHAVPVLLELAGRCTGGVDGDDEDEAAGQEDEEAGEKDCVESEAHDGADRGNVASSRTAGRSIDGAARRGDGNDAPCAETDDAAHDAVRALDLCMTTPAWGGAAPGTVPPSLPRQPPQSSSSKSTPASASLALPSSTASRNFIPRATSASRVALYRPYQSHRRQTSQSRSFIFYSDSLAYEQPELLLAILDRLLATMGAHEVARRVQAYRGAQNLLLAALRRRAAVSARGGDAETHRTAASARQRFGVLCGALQRRDHDELALVLEHYTGDCRSTAQPADDEADARIVTARRGGSVGSKARGLRDAGASSPTSYILSALAPGSAFAASASFAMSSAASITSRLTPPLRSSVSPQSSLSAAATAATAPYHTPYQAHQRHEQYRQQHLSPALRRASLSNLDAVSDALASLKRRVESGLELPLGYFDARISAVQLAQYAMRYEAAAYSMIGIGEHRGDCAGADSARSMSDAVCRRLQFDKRLVARLALRTLCDEACARARRATRVGDGDGATVNARNSAPDAKSSSGAGVDGCSAGGNNDAAVAAVVAGIVRLADNDATPLSESVADRARTPLATDRHAAPSLSSVGSAPKRATPSFADRLLSPGSFFFAATPTAPPIGYEPFIDALLSVHAVQRDVRRNVDGAHDADVVDGVDENRSRRNEPRSDSIQSHGRVHHRGGGDERWRASADAHGAAMRAAAQFAQRLGYAVDAATRARYLARCACARQARDAVEQVKGDGADGNGDSAGGGGANSARAQVARDVEQILRKLGAV